MTEKLENKLRMYYSVCAVCDANIDLWEIDDAFKASYEKFQSYIPVIQKYRDILKMEHIASETLKSYDRVELEEMGFYICSKLIQYAKDTCNEKILSEARENRNMLLRASNNELLSICNFISNEALNNIDRLSDYSISKENIAEFQRLLSFFSANINRVRNSTTKHKSAQEILAKNFKDADEVIKRLDDDIDFFKNCNPEFYNQYKAARIVMEVDDNFYANKLTNNAFNFTN